MVNMNICKNKIVKNIKDSNGNIIIGIYVILSGCKVFDYITFGLSRNIGKSVVLVRPGWSYLFLFVNTLLRKQEVLKYMGEVMICRGGRGSGSGGGSHGSNKELVTLTFVESMNWMVPENIVNNEVSVRLFGGGGGGGMQGFSATGNMCGGGGGAGWMNNDIVTVYSGEVIPIIIGAGGIGGNIYSLGANKFDSNNKNSKSGGTTSFGGYLYAIGGEGGTAYFGGNGSVGGLGGNYYLWSGISFQFGGTASNLYGHNQDNYAAGGPWGGGGSITVSDVSYIAHSNGWGSGGIYGGGGGAYALSGGFGSGGNGGLYGGGGGSATIFYDSSSNYISVGGRGGEYGGGGGSLTNRSSIGGIYGGNGGANAANIAPKNGINTIGWTNVAKDDDANIYLTGNGIKGATNSGGGGGYGGNGGKGTSFAGGGGGGYGGSGGIGRRVNWSGSYFNAGGGGGGYGSNGGNDGGGGGGYGIDANGGHNFGGGGGYHSYGGSYGGTGGGYYTPGRGKNNSVAPYNYMGVGGTGYTYNGINYSFGGNGWLAGNSTNTLYSAEDGNSGICIVQYYRWV